MKLHEWRLPHRRCLALLLTLALTGAASSLFLPRLLDQGPVDSLDCICTAVFLTVTVAGSFNFWLFVVGFLRAPSPRLNDSPAFAGTPEEHHLTPPAQSKPLPASPKRFPAASRRGEGLALSPHEAERGITTRTALVMPIYNEDVERVYLGIRQTWLSVLRAGLGRHCAFFILSDSTEPEIQGQEEAMVERLRKEFSAARSAAASPLTPALSPLRGEGEEDGASMTPTFKGQLDHLTPALSLSEAVMEDAPAKWIQTGSVKRPAAARETDAPFCLLRRQERTKYKAGNIANFLETRGWQYDFMIVLDADSVMLGDTIKRLVLTMQERPRTAILQTVVLAIRAATPFAQIMQFGNARCIPLFSRGMDWFFGPESIYWGHNAIIRIAPFMEHCNLPIMPGKPPLGGHIMSQDIVEAALLGRAGWAVEWDTEARGSYDETPSNILSYGLRDRRWCQGNLQHFWLIFGDRMKLGHRLYFANGVFSYAGSAMFLLLTILAFVQGLRGRFYEITPLLVGGFLAFYLLLLLLPKILGIIHRVRTVGCVVREVASGVLELVLSTLVSASLVYLHTRFILEILCGRISPWKSPSRNPNESLSWSTASRLFWLPTLLGLGWLVWAWLKTPGFLIYLGPLICGWLLSIPLAVWTSSPRLGAWLERRGLLGSTLTPEERAELGPLGSE